MKKINSLTLLFILFVSVLISTLSFAQEAKSEIGSRTIYLIRHGEYNHDDSLGSYAGKGLVPLGIAQAKLVAARLKAMPITFNALYSSTMTRARQTAQTINLEFPELKLEQFDILSECTPPRLNHNYKSKKDSLRGINCKNNIEESFSKFFIPSQNFEDKYDIIVCHGNVIRYLVTKALKVNNLNWLGMDITNCALTIIKIRPNGKMKLICFNDSGHIPYTLKTSVGDKKYNKAKLLFVE